VHYMLIGITSVLSSLGSEIKEIARIELDVPDVVDANWKLVDMTAVRHGSTEHELQMH
jgi:hypothetical protein